MFKYRNDNRFPMFVENIQGESVKLDPGAVWSTKAAVATAAGLTLVTPSKPKAVTPKTPKKPKKAEG